MQKESNTEFVNNLECVILDLVKHNKLDNIIECLGLISKLINNIVANPNDSKFSQFNKNKENLKNKVLNIKGINMFLDAVGYKEETNNSNILKLNNIDKTKLTDALIVIDRSLLNLQKSLNKITTSNEPTIEEGSLPVMLFVYDLTNGMAKQFGPMLIGKSVEGVWHTGISVYNTEYFFGGGICQSKPKQSPYGYPVKEIKLGGTFITKELFEDFLKEIKNKYSAETYNLINNNCNHFTDACAEFLTGNGIPKDILNQHEVLLNTPMGKMLMPYLQNMGSNSIPSMFENKK